MDIQSISTLLCLLLVLDVLFPSIDSFFSNPTALIKSDVLPALKSLSPPTVFDLQASDWVHCEEETGAHTGKYTAKL